MTVRPDTEIEARLKIVEIDGVVRTLKEDVTEIKTDVRRIFQRMDILSQSEGRYAGLLELVNGNATRADLRWDQLISDRRADLADWRAWRDSVENYKSMARLIGTLLVLCMGAITAAGDHYYGLLHDERDANAKMIQQTAASEAAELAIHNGRIEKNSDRLRAAEAYLLRKDPDYRPSQ